MGSTILSMHLAHTLAPPTCDPLYLILVEGALVPQTLDVGIESVYDGREVESLHVGLAFLSLELLKLRL